VSTLRKANRPMRPSTKGTATLKRKQSKVVKAPLPKKRRGPTRDTILLSDTSSNESDNPSIIDSSTVQTDIEEEEGADIELGMSPFIFYEKKMLRIMPRTLEKGLERTNLLLLPPSTNH